MPPKVTIAVIPCAGKGTRISGLTAGNSKTLIPIGKKRIIEYILDICEDVQITEVYIIVGKGEHHIQDLLTRSDHSFEINYLVQEISKGIGNAISLVEAHISTNFLVLLGDEFFLHSNHRAMTAFFKKNMDCLLGVKTPRNPLEIKKNYAISVTNSKIERLIEKPDDSQITNNILGTGSIIFNTKIFPAIARTEPSSLRNEIELIDSINNLIQMGGNVNIFPLEGEYVNINEEKDLQLATTILQKVARK